MIDVIIKNALALFKYSTCSSMLRDALMCSLCAFPVSPLTVLNIKSRNDCTSIVKNVSFILSPVELLPSYAGATHTTPPTTGNSTHIPTQKVSNEIYLKIMKKCWPCAVIPLEWKLQHFISPTQSVFARNYGCNF